MTKTLITLTLGIFLGAAYHAAHGHEWGCGGPDLHTREPLHGLQSR